MAFLKNQFISFFFLFGLMLPTIAFAQDSCVVLVHGLGDNQHSMKSIARMLKKKGYRVWNQSYPSTALTIEELSSQTIHRGLDYCEQIQAASIHFVTHSMGGLLVRQFLQDQTIPNLGKIVMLAPPNQGSEVYDVFKKIPFYEYVSGPAGQQLGTGKDSLPNSLAPIEAEIGILMGKAPWGGVFSGILPGEDDGRVSMESAKLQEMNDFLVVEADHASIVKKVPVFQQILYFLRKGHFFRGSSQSLSQAVATLPALQKLESLSSRSLESTKKGCVLLFHGIGRNAFNLRHIEQILEQQNYLVWNHNYPSTFETIEALALKYVKKGIDYCETKNTQPIHFVTHSMGGLLVRYFLQDHEVPHLGKIVMLAPPNKGSEIVDHLKDWFLFQLMLGPAGQQMGTAPDSFPNTLRPINATIGIMIGNDPVYDMFSGWIPGDDDGKVSLENAKLAEMKDFMVVNAGHTNIIQTDSVLKQIVYFLQYGKFQKPLLSQN